MAKREKKPEHHVQMTDGKYAIDTVNSFAQIHTARLRM